MYTTKDVCQPLNRLENMNAENNKYYHKTWATDFVKGFVSTVEVAVSIQDAVIFFFSPDKKSKTFLLSLTRNAWTLFLPALFLHFKILNK